MAILFALPLRGVVTVSNSSIGVSGNGDIQISPCTNVIIAGPWRRLASRQVVQTTSAGVPGGSGGWRTAVFVRWAGRIASSVAGSCAASEKSAHRARATGMGQIQAKLTS